MEKVLRPSRLAQKKTTPSYPYVEEKKVAFATPWVNFVEKKVIFSADTSAQSFYALTQENYISIVAVTPSKKILTVRQYRPAVEAFTLELPAGTIESGESPEDACKRELIEETGHLPLKIKELGSYYPDTGRITNLQYSFFVEVEAKPASEVKEAGITLEYYSFEELKSMIRNETFRHQLHISVLLAARHVFDCF